MKPRHIEVLVVGAGPVGMLTALQLARDGVNVRIIDEADGVCTQSYACALHGRTVQLLSEMGLDASLLESGHKLDRVALYDGHERRAEIPMVQVVPESPMLLVLSQADLEATLAEALKQEGVRIMWNHRLAGLRLFDRAAHATIEELEGTAVGYASPHWEIGVKRSFECETAFIIGCDGRQSKTRQLAGIELESLSHPELFLLYEFDSNFHVLDELRIVLNATDSNVLWPLPEGRFRWGFQWTEGAPDGEYPIKERHFWSEDAAVAAQSSDHLHRLIHERAPWFTGSVDAMDWATDVQFEPCLVRHFGIGRCWLAGDAAHQTGPIGVQSMNLGMREGAILARRVREALDGSSLAPLKAYENEFLPEWQRLLGMSSRIEPADTAFPPLINARNDLIECLPAYGHDLDAMLGALRLRVHCAAVPTA